MPLADRNIVITPNRGSSSEPQIRFTGANTATSATIVLKIYNSSTVGQLSIEGNAGQLFSIVDSLSGSLFSVNDVSGLPSIEVFDTGEVRFAQFSGYVNIANTASATSTATGALRVRGGVGIGGDLYARNIYSSGTLLGASSTTATQVQTQLRTTSADHFVTFVDANNASATGELVYTTSSFIINPSTGRVGLGITPNSVLHVSGDARITGITTVTNTTNATSTTTGALQVIGGVGIGGNIQVGGTVVGGGVRTSSTSTAPSSPTVGDIWYNTSDDTIYRYTSDGTTNYWIDITGPASVSGQTGATGPSGTSEIVFSVPGSLSTGTGTSRYYFARTVTVSNVIASVGTAPTGASVIVDVNKNGTTIFTTQANRPTIAINSFTDLTSVPDITSFVSGDYLTVDIDQVGSTATGADLMIRIAI